MIRLLILLVLVTLAFPFATMAKNGSRVSESKPSGDDEPISLSCKSESGAPTASGAAAVSWQPGRHLIRRMSLPHCKRGPMRCPKCKTGEGKIVFCLIDIDPPRQGMVQRPVCEMLIGGKKVFKEYDVIKIFEVETEARACAEKHKLTDCLWEEEPSVLTR